MNLSILRSNAIHMTSGISLQMASLVRLLDSSGQHFIDSVAGEYEDCFTLENFEDLCNSYADIGKSYIIARVHTFDPKHQEKSFYSYYDAYQLNKILFQTQIILKKKYIHRLHVLNPLSNTDIIGHVQYYKVIARSVEDSLPAKHDAQSSKTLGHLNIDTLSKTEGCASECVSPTVHSIDNGQLSNWTVSHHQIVAENNDNHTPIPYNSIFFDRVNYKGYNQCIKVPINEYFETKKLKRCQSLNVTIQLVSDAKIFETATRVTLTPGLITQFAVEIQKKDLESSIPETQKAQHVKLSYRNAVSASNAPATFLEWAQILRDDVKNNFAEPKIMHEQNNNILDKINICSHEQKDTTIWEAILFATDDDYLMTSATRQFFFQNSLNLENANLFEMKECTGEEPNERDNYPGTSMCTVM